ncbi:MAG: sugar ABC transporter permease [Dermatophilaceae bacterium]
MSTPGPTPTPQDAPNAPASAGTDVTAALPTDLQDERLVASEGLGGWLSASFARLRTGDLGSFPVVVGLVIIWGVFWALNPAFVSSRNLVNLTMQCAGVGTIAIGIVLVLLLGEIDLSVGSMSGLAAAVLAVTFVNQERPVLVAVLAALLAGLVVGLVYGLLYTRFGVPSFVITLAGLLAFLGVQLIVLGDKGTINIPFESSIADFASQQFLPPWLAYALALAAMCAFLVTRLRAEARRRAAGLSVTPTSLLLVRAALLLIVLAVPVFLLSQDRGVSVMVLTFVLLVVVMDFAIRRTRWGRSVLAVGGNVEAARRAGINVKGVYISVFALCSTFAALGGIFMAARLLAAGQSSGTGDVNLNAIASAVIGGTSLFGGRGSAYSALLGILVIQSISNGLDLFSVGAPPKYMVTGAVLLIAVIIDSVSRRSRAAHGRA